MYTSSQEFSVLIIPINSRQNMVLFFFLFELNWICLTSELTSHHPSWHNYYPFCSWARHCIQPLDWSCVFFCFLFCFIIKLWCLQILDLSLFCNYLQISFIICRMSQNLKSPLCSALWTCSLKLTKEGVQQKHPGSSLFFFTLIPLDCVRDRMKKDSRSHS